MLIAACIASIWISFILMHVLLSSTVAMMQLARHCNICPFRGSSLVLEPSRKVAKQQLQDCLELVVMTGCANLLSSDNHQQPANSQGPDYFFDLKLVAGQRFCLCHR